MLLCSFLSASFAISRSSEMDPLKGKDRSDRSLSRSQAVLFTSNEGGFAQKRSIPFQSDRSFSVPNFVL